MADERFPAGKPPAGPHIQLQIDDATAQGAYVNVVLINHSENEFVLDFAWLPPGLQAARVRSRIISSPQHAKRLLLALQKNMERYEERFGAIAISEEQLPPIKGAN
jgi:hypothetical protein